MLEWVDLRLMQWASSVRREQSGGLGYPTRTVEARLMREGAGAAIRGKGGSRLPADLSNRDFEVDRAVAVMPSELRATVEVAYLTYGDRKIQAETLARRLRRPVRRQALTELLDRSHYWLAGRLSRGG